VSRGQDLPIGEPLFLESSCQAAANPQNARYNRALADPASKLHLSTAYPIFQYRRGINTRGAPKNATIIDETDRTKPSSPMGE